MARNLKKSPRPTKTDIKRPNQGAAHKKRWQDPAFRDKMAAARRDWHQRRKGNSKTFRLGVPNGMRREEAEREWAFARMYAKEVTKIMVEKNIIEDDPRVALAFEKTLEVLESPMNQEVKLKAARQILDFLKAKPVAKSEITVQKAEDWLAQVIADNTSNE